MDALFPFIPALRQAYSDLDLLRDNDLRLIVSGLYQLNRMAEQALNTLTRKSTAGYLNPAVVSTLLSLVEELLETLRAVPDSRVLKPFIDAEAALCATNFYRQSQL